MPYNFNGIESLFTPQYVYRLKHEKGKLKHRAKCDYTGLLMEDYYYAERSVMGIVIDLLHTYIHSYTRAT